MPGIFSVRDVEERDYLFQEWLETTCYRDTQQFKKMRIDGELCFQLMKLAATVREPVRSEFSRELGVDSRKVDRHLAVLCELFGLIQLNPHHSGTGKPMFLPLDTGIAQFLGASQERLLHIWLVNERLANAAYSLFLKKVDFYYYRSTGKKTIHLIEEPLGGKAQALQILDFEKIRKTDAELMKAFLKKNSKHNGRVLAPITLSQKIGGVSIEPWEQIITRG